MKTRRTGIKMLCIITALLTSNICNGFYPIVRNFEKGDHKGGAQSWSITQGSGGTMWFANSGILEFDGEEWNIIKTRNMTGVRSVYFDHETERLYFGATDEFGYLHINEGKRMEYISLKDSINVNFGEIWDIHKENDNLWLRENNKMYFYDFKDIKQYSFADKVAVSRLIGGRPVIFVNNVGVLEYRWNGQFEIMPGTESLKGMRVCAIIPYDEEELMLVTSTEGIYILKEGVLTESRLDFSRQLMEDNVYCAETNGRYIAFGTVTNGVWIHDKVRGNTMHLNTFSGLQNNTILDMYYDDAGNLWLAMDKGIDMIELGSPEYRLFGDSNQFGAGYASEIFEGRLWLGTNQGLYNADFTEEGQKIKDEDIVEVKAVKGQVWSLLNHDGRLFCCNDKGIHIVKDGNIRHIPMNGAWKLEILRNNREYLLGCSYDRLFLLKKQGSEWIFDGWIEGFDEASKVFEEDKDGKIWFSHWVKGLFRLDIDLKQKKVIDEEYFSSNEGFPADWSNTPMEIDGEIIFHTIAGIYCFDSYNMNAYPHQRMNSLFNTPPAGTSIYVTSDDDFYFSSGSTQTLCYRTNNGFVVDSLSLKHIKDKRIAGFEDIRSLSDNSILVNTEDGFSVIRTEKVKHGNESEGIHDLFIKDIYVTKASGDSLIFSSRNDSIGRNSTLTLPYRDNSLKFKVISPLFLSGKNVEYSYMLENYDRGWSQYSSTNTKEYTRLPAGKYTFRAKARFSFCENINETEIDVVIRSPWYFSTLALMIYMMVSLILGWLASKAVKNYIYKRTLQLKRKNEEEMLKKQMRLDLEHKAEDLAASAMNVVRKNEILLSIDRQLQRVTEYIGEDRNKCLKILQSIRRDIHENIQYDNAWDEFKENFDVVYNDYLERLGNRYPQLSRIDKKMCVYLKIGLNSKEIAPLLNMTVRSVEMSRYRLRKKMDLQRETNLTEFLQNF